MPEFLVPIVLVTVGVVTGNPYLVKMGLMMGATTLVGKAIAKPPRAPAAVHSAGRTQSVRQAISPWEVVLGKVRKGGVLTFRYISSDRQYWHMVLTLACHPCEAIDAIYFADEEVWTSGGGVISKYASHVRIRTSLGTESGQPFPDLVAETDGRWTNDHLQYGHTKIYVRLQANPELFPSGIPNVSALIRGAKLFDPRTGTTVYSNNAALAINNVLTESASGYGLQYDYTNEIDQDDLIAAANSCDDAIPLAAGGTEPRYTVNGSYGVDEEPKTVLERLLAACAGTLVDQGDKWRINVGVYHPPTVTLSETHLAGPSVINPHIASRDSANGVKGIFTNPNAHWQPDDFPALQGTTYLSEDGGVRHWLDMDFSGFVTSITQAQRLSKIALLKARQPLTEEATFKLAAWQAVPGKTLARTDSQLGWSAKVFEVLDTELAVVEDGDNVTLAVKHSLRETAAAIYDWTTGEEQAEDLAPNTNLPDPGIVPVPGAPYLHQEVLISYDSRVIATKALIRFAQSTYPFGAKYQLEYKLASVSTWTVLPQVQIAVGSTGDIEREIPDIGAGLYDFRVQTIGHGGGRSAYSTSTGIEIRGLTAEPSDVSGFYVTVHEGRARCHLDLTVDKDVQIGGRVWLRWSPLSAGATWNDGSLIKLDGYPGDSIVCEGPLYPGTYMAKFEDSTGHFSRTEASFVVTESLLTGFTTLNTVTFHPTFDGTKVNTVASDSALFLTGSTLWDSMVGNLDSQTLIDSLGGVASSGSCTFTSKQDLGSVQTVRLFPHVKSLAFDTVDLWDSRTTLMDGWGLVDGGVIEDAEIQPQVRITNDDPNGSPTWGPWHNLEVMDVTCRGLEYRTLHTSGNVTHNRRLSEFSVAAKQLT
jgi:hypothetical protein